MSSGGVIAGGVSGGAGAAAAFNPWAVGIGAAVNIGMGLWGASKASAAQDRAEEAKIKAIKAQHQHDLNVWDFKKQAMQASRMEAVDAILMKATNEGKLRAYKDVSAQEQYDYALRIRDQQQAGNEAAFKRSEDIYKDTTHLNFLAAKTAMDSEIVKLEESKDEQAFDRQESYLDMLKAEGQLRARGASGRSASKAVQATVADYGRQMAMLNASSDSMDRNTHGVLDEIIRDKTSADLTAWASKMLDPGVLPMPIKPRPIPVASFMLPRALQDYDFGPMPVEGAMPAGGVGSDMAWATALTSMGTSLAGSINTYVQNQN